MSGSPVGPTPPAAPAPKRRLKVLLRVLVLMVICFVVSLPIGMGLRAAFFAAESSASESQAAPPTRRLSREGLRLDSEDPDDLLRAGCFPEALAAFQSLPEDAPSRAYREALCLEALGRHAEADEAYQHAAPATADVATWARATLGRARCAAARDKLPSAERLLDSVALRSGDPGCRGRRILEECLSLRAAIGLRKAGPPHAANPFAQNAPAWAPRGANVAEYLDWLPTDAAEGEHHGAEPVPSGTAVVEYDPLLHEEPELIANLAAAPVRDHLSAIAAAAGLKLRVDADDGLLDATTPVDVRRMPFAEALAALTGTAGVTWHVEDHDLVIQAAHPHSHEDARNAARAGLRRVLSGAPDHPDTLVNRVALANLDFEAGLWRQAGRQYQALLESRPNAAEGVYAAYNLGLVEIHLDHLPAARTQFLEVLDRRPGSAWADLARWWIGRTHLDTGDLPAARKEFAMVVESTDREVASAAALGMCVCDLLGGQDDSARETLRGRRFMNTEAHAAITDLFETLLRYRESPSDGRRAGTIDALEEAGLGRSIGLAGVVLTGELYSELGLRDRMVAAYEAALESARGPFAVQMTFRIAERFEQLDKRNEARQRYLAVSATDPGGLGPTAELRVADLAARDGRGDECVRRCRSLIGRPGVERDALLRVLGRGYELQKKYRLAAECFSGKIPAE